ncbi:Ig-like domain-containing protein [Mycolicibacterium sp.]|uniref:Ig-like domain-containing protein n=1 Tax=Mycolicibacterium sp. TaxID=2320850 RepID=UPI001A33410C|nr:Ig-like domain-containing protein [Mycolicibacterium sp.]MBJ7340761.1 tandem-95 repeat protein [Mycolicibacterium sp.]
MPIAPRHRAIRTEARHRRNDGLAQAVYPAFRLNAAVARESTYARHVGRIGALAVALGVGAALATSHGAGMAYADDGSDPTTAGTTSASSHDASPNAATTATPAASMDVPTGTTGTSGTSGSAGSATTTRPTVPEMNVSSSGGAHTSGDDGPSVTASTTSPATDVEPEVEALPDKAPVIETSANPASSTSRPAVTKTPAAHNDSPVASAQPATAPRPLPVAAAVASTADEDVPAPSTSSAVDTRAPAVSTGLDTTAIASAPAAVELQTPPPPVEAPSVATILAAAIAPFVLPGPAAPVTSPLLLAIMAWSRREFDQIDGTALAARAVVAADPGPVAVDDEYTTEEDFLPSYGNVLDNDDIPGVGVAVLTTGPAHGTVDLQQDGQFFYTPDHDFNGQDSFTYTLDDLSGSTSSATVTITVTPTNDPPVGSNTAITLAEDGSYTGTLPKATDIDGDALVYGSFFHPANGTAVVNSDGTFTYTPNANFHGADGFFYTVSDGTVTQRYTVEVTVTAVNDAPVASNVVTTIGEDTYLNGFLPVTDVDGDTLTYTLTAQATRGVAVVDADGRYSYTPAKDFNGVDTFTYGYSDGTVSGTRTVTVTVTAANDTPVSEHLELTMDEDTILKGTIPASDADGDPMTYELFGTPMNGTMVIDIDGSFTYTPKPDFNGVEYLTYQIKDGTSYSQYTIYITVRPVNDAPVAKDHGYDTFWGVPVSDTVQYLGSDVDVAETLTFTVAKPGAGTISMNPDGSFVYTPRTGFSGADVFTYRVTDATGASALGTITVNVANVAPLTADDVYVVKNGNPLQVSVGNGVLANDYDPGDTLTVVSNTTPSQGTVTMSPDGSFTYTPNVNAIDYDQFTYTMRDLAGLTATGRVTVYFEQDNRPPVVRDYDLTVVQGKTLEFNPLDDAEDPDDDPLMVRNVSDPTSGFTQAITGGAIAYVPDPNFVGVDSFTYQIFDGYQYVTGKVRVTVTPAAEYDAYDDDFEVRSDDVGVSLDVLANDLLPRNGAVTVEIDGQPTGGTIVFDQNTQTFLYTPFLGTRSDGFTYRITNPKDPLTYDYASVSITVVQLDDPPEAEAEDDAASTTIDTAVTIDVLDNDRNPGDRPLAVEILSPPTYGGKAEVQKDGTIRFTPEKGFVGSVQFAYGITDDRENVSSAIVTVVVYDPTPVYHDKSYTVGKDRTLTVSANAGVLTSYGFEGWRAGLVEKPRNGQVTVNEDGSFTYTPDRGFVGTDTFRYFAATSEMGDSATVTIEVTDVGVEQPGTAISVSGGSGFGACGNDWWPRGNGKDDVWPLCLYPEARRPSQL